MSATKKKATTTTSATTRKATTRKATTRKTTTRKRTSTARRRATTTRRTQPKVATTVGAALGTLVVALLLDASWPVRIGLVLLALLLVGGYLYLQGRRHDADEPAGEEPAVADRAEEASAPSVEPNPPSSSMPATPATLPAPTIEDTP